MPKCTDCEFSSDSEAYCRIVLDGIYLDAEPVIKNIITITPCYILAKWEHTLINEHVKFSNRD